MVCIKAVYDVKMTKMYNSKDLHMTAPSLACQEVSFPMHICNKTTKIDHKSGLAKSVIQSSRTSKGLQASTCNLSFSLAPWVRVQKSHDGISSTK